MKTCPFPCTTIPLCSTQTPVSYSTQLCISIKSPSSTGKKKRTCAFSVYFGSLAVGMQWTGHKHTHIALVALKRHQIGNMTKTPKASLEFGVKQYMSNCPSPRPPLTFNLLCQQGCPAGMQEPLRHMEINRVPLQTVPSNTTFPRISNMCVSHKQGQGRCSPEKKEEKLLKKNIAQLRPIK